MTRAAGPRTSWESEGRRLSTVLDGVAAAVVAGDRADPAARVALGAAFVQATRRRVTIIDLAGDTPALQALIPGEDPHGITDAFQYGLSLARLARPAGHHPQLFVVPTGADPLVDEAMLADPRWAELVHQLREDGELLLLVARGDQPGLNELVLVTDGVVVVGNGEAVSALPSVLAVAALPAPAASAPRVIPAPTGDRRWWPWGVAALVIAGLAVGAWYLYSRGAEARAASNRASAAPPPNATPRATLPDSLPTLTVANPTDSLRAAQYGIEVVAHNTLPGAQATMMENANYLPAPTITPVRLNTAGARWFKLVVGAYTTRRSADSALAQLRRRAVMSDSGGEVVHVPYALRLEAEVPRDSVRLRLAYFVSRDVYAYALLQPNGRADILAGAFAQPADAALLAAHVARQLRGETSAITPTLVFRTGRVF
ncbi:MAG TPA: hypothetical protein VFY16_00115 [Gemmatimonadaceae bacterium]|nr:hypothetical protein [Gemmatimonadaceae bacterium]